MRLNSPTIQITETQVNGLKLIFTHLRAVYLPQDQNLIISDLHLGKTTHFQKNGFAVPKEVAVQDLNNLGLLLQHFQPKKLIIAGDFFHASENSEINLFKAWKQKWNNKIPFLLVKGNHDRLKKSKYLELGLQFVEHFKTEKYIVTHQPAENAKQFNIYGHIHPGVVLKGLGKQQLKLPCFLLSEKALVLPAFSKFTGLDTRYYHDFDAYVIGDHFVEKI